MCAATNAARSAPKNDASSVWGPACNNAVSHAPKVPPAVLHDMLPETRPAVLQGLQQHVCCNKRCKKHSPKRCKQCLGTCLQQRCESCSQGAASSVARQMTTDGLACSHSFSTASWSAVNSAFMLQQTLQKTLPKTMQAVLGTCLQQRCQ